MYDKIIMPDERLENSKPEDAAKQLFFMITIPEGEGKDIFILKFKNGINLMASRQEMNEMINQLSLGLMT